MKYNRLPIDKPLHLSKKHPSNLVQVIRLLILLIPLIIIAYLIFSNFIISKEFNYYYDIGTSQEDYLTPEQRISLPIYNQDTTLRELTSGLVYFDSPIPRGSKTVNVKVRFKDNFPESQFLLGARDDESWHYEWHTLYNPALENLQNFNIGKNVYKLNPTLDDKTINQIEKSEGLIIGSNIPLTNSPNYISDFQGESIITTSLRGGHTFYAYLSDDLNLEIQKQDINWYEGPDELSISIFNSDNTLISNIAIPDDGIIDKSKLSETTQSKTLNLLNLPEGVYRIELSEFDGIIKQIKINTKKIVISNKIYLADSEIFPPNLNIPSTIYTDFSRTGQISVKTWHDKAFQTIEINENPLTINSKVTPTIYTVSKPGLIKITSPKNDIIITTPGYFAFSPESYFEPFINRIFPIENEQQAIINNFDFIIAEYTQPEKDFGWLIAETQFNINDLYVKDNTLSLVLNTPHLSQDEFINYTIPIDWIEIQVSKPGAIK